MLGNNSETNVMCIPTGKKTCNDPIALLLHHISQRVVNTNIAAGEEDNSYRIKGKRIQEGFFCWAFFHSFHHSALFQTVPSLLYSNLSAADRDSVGGGRDV